MSRDECQTSEDWQVIACLSCNFASSPFKSRSLVEVKHGHAKASGRTQVFSRFRFIVAKRLCGPHPSCLQLPFCWCSKVVSDTQPSRHTCTRRLFWLNSTHQSLPRTLVINAYQIWASLCPLSLNLSWPSPMRPSSHTLTCSSIQHLYNNYTTSIQQPIQQPYNNSYFVGLRPIRTKNNDNQFLFVVEAFMSAKHHKYAVVV